MLEINTTHNRACKIIELKGRIDGITSSVIEKEFMKLTSEGSRIIAVNLSNVNYVSSAGLRIFLSSQKMLKRIGGELLIISLQPQIQEVFSTSGFISLFRIFKDDDEFEKEVNFTPVIHKVINGRNTQYKKLSSPAGKIFNIGNQDKLQNTLYNMEDVIEVSSSDIQFGTGMAALGDSYNEYKLLFGETVIINNNFFSYPAVKRPAVDFMLKGEPGLNFNYNFLYGTGFNGSYSSVIKLHEDENCISLSEVVSAAKELSGTNIFGIVLMAESAGIYAMNLKKSPIAENIPATGEIFSHNNFADWIDFPLDPAFGNNIIAAAGIVVKDKNLLEDKFKSITAEDSDFHIHCVVFEKEFLTKNIDSFDEELKRIINDLQPLKVQHLLGQSKFKSGMLAIIELEEC
jgi:anti-anti-sigma factor